jgi:NTE family protein
METQDASSDATRRQVPAPGAVAGRDATRLRHPECEGDLALVMSGGGALAAYQVGVLRHLADGNPGLCVPILTGVSAGAVNAASLACLPGDFRQRVLGLEAAWLDLCPEKVFKVNSLHLLGRVLRWGLRLLSGRQRPVARPKSLLDTAPLREFLSGRFCHADGTLRGIDDNLAAGQLRALAITASSYSTSHSVTWVHDHSSSPWQRAHRTSTRAAMRIDHVMASAALPLVFPAVEVDGQWFGDGGMRLTAPFSPAIHLGAGRILSISTRFKGRDAATPAGPEPYPPPAQIAGALLNSLFLEHSDDEALRVARINRLLEDLPDERRHGLRPIDFLVVHPTVDLCALANDYEPRLPRTLRFLIHGLGSGESRSNDLLSLLMFQKDYIRALIDIGRQDAARRGAEIAAFLAPVRTAARGRG